MIPVDYGGQEWKKMLNSSGATSNICNTFNFDKRRQLNFGQKIIELLMYFKIAKMEK